MDKLNSDFDNDMLTAGLTGLDHVPQRGPAASQARQRSASGSQPAKRARASTTSSRTRRRTDQPAEEQPQQEQTPAPELQAPQSESSQGQAPQSNAPQGRQGLEQAVEAAWPNSTAPYQPHSEASARAASAHEAWKQARNSICHAHIVAQGVPEDPPSCCHCGSPALLKCLDCKRFQDTFLCAKCDLAKHHPWVHLCRRLHCQEGCWVPMSMEQGFNAAGALIYDQSESPNS